MKIALRLSRSGPSGRDGCRGTGQWLASSPLHTPAVEPFHGTRLLLALAVQTRLPSTAEPHWSPPAVPPGPAWVSPTHLTGVGFDRPVLAALLAGAHDFEVLTVKDARGEQGRCLAEVVVGACPLATVDPVTEERDAPCP